jgi:hypothetical protein
MAETGAEDWTDLAANQAGRGVKAEAEAARRANHVRNVVARLLGVHTDAAAWTKGGKGEELVGKRLAKLGPAWRVIHSIPVGTKGTDIDHLVIGPGGVFTLNAKNHRGKRVWVNTEVVKVNGQSQRYIQISEHEAQKASRLLSATCGFGVAATGVVVIVADSLKFAGKPTRARVVGRKDIAYWLRRQPPALDATAVESIFAMARRSTTWV